jgi:hypothetical protein
MSEETPITKVEAVRLGNALVAQIERRKAAMALEACCAQGVEISSKDFVRPDDWVLNAARIANENIVRAFRLQDVQAKDTASQVGVCIGLARTFGAILKGHSTEEQNLEEKHPELTKIREKLDTISEAEMKLGSGLELQVAKENLSPIDQREYGKGRFDGSNLVVDETGGMRDDDTTRAEVCYFIWLYWPELRFLTSRAELLRFLKEFRVEGITMANLSKICREIRFHLKGPGRPAK